MPEIARLDNKQRTIDYNLVSTTVDDIRAEVPGFAGGGPLKLQGCNVAWYDYGGDFGTGAVANNRSRYRDRFAGFRNTTGMKVFRWWTFSSGAWQINRDGAGNPTGLNNSIYQDFNMAIDIANELDIYYIFNLFNFAGNAHQSYPMSWWQNATHRTNLFNVLGPLFETYANEPRILSWEGFNECEAAMQGWSSNSNLLTQQQMIDCQAAFVDSVHRYSNTWASCDSMHMDGPVFWSNKGIMFDLWQPHWYEYMSPGGWDASSQDYASVQARCVSAGGSLRGKPLIVAEFRGGEATAQTRWNAWHDRYNGGLAWSLFHERTADQYQITHSAAANYTAQRNPQYLPNNLPVRTTAIVNGTSYPFRKPGRKKILHRNIAVGSLEVRAR